MPSKIMKTIVLITCIFLSAPSVLSADETMKGKLNSFDIAQVTLDDPVTRIGADGKTNVYREAFLIRLNGEFPVNGARLLELFIGDERIAEYGGFPKGIYFLAFHQEELSRWSGKKFGFRFSSNEKKSLGAVFQFDRTHCPKMSMKEALER